MKERSNYIPPRRSGRPVTKYSIALVSAGGSGGPTANKQNKQQHNY